MGFGPGKCGYIGKNCINPGNMGSGFLFSR